MQDNSCDFLRASLLELVQHIGQFEKLVRTQRGPPLRSAQEGVRGGQIRPRKRQVAVTALRVAAPHLLPAARDDGQPLPPQGVERVCDDGMQLCLKLRMTCIRRCIPSS